MKQLVVVIFISLILTACGMSINEEIPQDTTAKQLVEIAEPYVRQYWSDGRAYYLGAIYMHFDQDLNGLGARLRYKDDKRNGDGAPHMISVRFDMEQHLILKISSDERKTRNEPGTLDIGEWNIDSDEAIEIALTALGKYDGFSFTAFDMYWAKVYEETENLWIFSFVDEENARIFRAEVNVATGECLLAK